MCTATALVTAALRKTATSTAAAALSLSTTAAAHTTTTAAPMTTIGIQAITTNSTTAVMMCMYLQYLVKSRVLRLPQLQPAEQLSGLRQVSVEAWQRL